VFLYKESPRDSIERVVLWRGVILIFLIGIALSYTRATWLSILLLPIFGFILRKKLVKLSLIVGLIGVSVIGSYFIYNSNYLKYAPDYETTVFYRDSFGDHMNATFEMKDVSGMERIYRWVASVKMFADKPIMGAGPNTFYPNYFNYTVSSFQTYVSDNPEKSTVHNYFLLLLSEQGIIGFLLFTGFLFLVLLKAQKSYFGKLSKSKKNLLIASVSSIFILLLHLMLNDLIEVDKIAAGFFLSCVIILKIEDIGENSEEKE
jgi:O-antigen ligase